MANEYGLHIPEALEKRLGRCRASVRTAIRERLRTIALAAGKSARQSKLVGPPLRFYVYDGYRVFYRLDPDTRRVVVLELAVAPS